MVDTMEEMTLVVSYKDSLTPNWMSSLPKNIGWAPKKAEAPSEEILVLVDLLEKTRATVLPKSFWWFFKMSDLESSLMIFLKAMALVTRVSNSLLDNSEMEIK
ncbi:hypothetical protein WICPIJ_005086 [Wickerhamomyces pijperi]|uniref:Uncharacterized protein n=1 Tax=Wickerhamomyces pijperi TaxID=599730 RepID=A0A9P8Q489_WICPI|nr:hypothetical protein WICPIJ_005086 [Wickerhamomyces pijperi]